MSVVLIILRNVRVLFNNYINFNIRTEYSLFNIKSGLNSFHYNHC